MMNRIPALAALLVPGAISLLATGPPPSPTAAPSAAVPVPRSSTSSPSLTATVAFHAKQRITIRPGETVAFVDDDDNAPHVATANGGAVRRR
jgi:photosystem II stability/assembly factor-like uncharacterized protein